jgi:VWFA-related protein
MRSRLPLAICVLAAWTWQAGAQAPQDRPGFRTGVDLIQLDVSVLDKDRRPIRGLTAADFTVTENGRAQRVVALSEVSAAEQDPVRSAWMRHVPRDVAVNDLADQLGDGRLYAIVIDDWNLPWDARDIVRATREAARYFVDQLGPSDVAAIVYPADAGRTQDFTSDRDKLLEAIDRYDPRAHPYALPTPQGAGPWGGDMAQRYSPALMRSQCVRNQPLVPTLETLVARMAVVPERRKSLVLLSVGTPSIFGNQSSCATTLADMMKDAFRTAQRAHINIHGIDPSGYNGYRDYLDEKRLRGTMPGERAPLTDLRRLNEFLEIVSENTGGRAVVRTDAVQPSIDEIFEEHAAYYLIGYETTNGAPDGKFRKVDVKVLRPGASARTRSGYWAPRADALVNPRNDVAPAPLDLGQAGLFAPHGLPMRVTIVPLGRSSATGTAVDVGVVLTLRLPPLRSRVEETLTLTRHVYDADGAPGPPFQEAVALTLEPGPGDESRYDLIRSLSLAPGRYQIRLNAHSRVLDRNGSVYADFEVPDLTRQALAASGIALGRPADDGQTRADVLQDWLPVVPITTRDFASGEAITAVARIHQGAAAAAVTVNAQLFDRFDAVVMSRTDRLESDAFDARRGAAYQLPLPLDALASGPYLLSLTMRAGSRSVRRDIVFRIR